MSVELNNKYNFTNRGRGIKMNMKGFTYANIHSSEYALYVRSDNRTITPALRKNEFVISWEDMGL